MVGDLKSVSTHYDLSSSRTEYNDFCLFVKIKAIWDCSSQLLCKTGCGDLCNHTGFIVVWIGEKHFRAMGCNENREFYFLYLMLLFIGAVSLSRTSLIGFSKNKALEEGWGAGTSVVCPDSLSVGSSLFTAVKGGQGCGWGEYHRGGWSEQVPSTKFLQETSACLVTPLFLQIKIVYTLINKLYLGLAASHISAMETFQCERKYVYMWSSFEVLKLVQFLIWTKLYPCELPPFQMGAEVLLLMLQPAFAWLLIL